MTTNKQEEHIKFIKEMFFSNDKRVMCNDDTISFYHVADKENVIDIFNVRNFLSTIDNKWKRTPKTENDVNKFLFHILKTLSVIVFGEHFSENIFINKLYKHLDTFIELVYISDVSIEAVEALKFLYTKCNEDHPLKGKYDLNTNIYLFNNYGMQKEIIVIQLTLTDKVTKEITILTLNMYL